MKRKSAGIRQIGSAGWLLAGVSIAVFSATASAQTAKDLPRRAGPKPVPAPIARPVGALYFDIPAGELEPALIAYGERTGLKLVYPSTVAAGRSTPGAVGLMTPDEALDRLLADSGLAPRHTHDRTTTVVDAAYAQFSEAAPQQQAIALDTITVEGESPWGPVNGYAATRSASGTKTDTPIIETPQTISVVGAKEIRERNAQNLSDALGYVAGVGTSEGFQNDNETYLIRGFRAGSEWGSMYRDGTKFTVNVYNAPQEPYGLERVEVLKGASSVLYGTAAPGGIINTVTKRPPATPLRELGVSYGSFEQKQIFGDFGGPIDAKGEWSYRITGLYRDGETFKDYGVNDRAFIAPALTWRPSEATSLTILGEYQKDKSTPIYGLPAEGTVRPNINGKMSKRLFTGEPGFDENDQSRWSGGYIFEHAFNDALKLRSSARYLKAIADRPAFFLGTLQADQRTITRTANRSIDHSQAFVADQSLEYKWSVGNIVNTSLIGFDYTYQKHQQRVLQKAFTPIDLFAPVYGSVVGFLPTTSVRNFRKEQIGLYAQNQMKIADKLVVLLGGRYDRASYDNMANQLTSPLYVKKQDSAFTGRAGLVYLFDSGFAPYASYSQSFEPVLGADRTGASFKPTEGEQYEIGLRYQPPGSELLFTAAAYDLTQTNVSVTDPADPNFSVQQGKIRARGFEFEARGKVAEHWNVIAAYAYTDARTIESSPLTPQLAGKRVGNVPYHQVSLWADYDFAAFGLPGLTMGAGLRYVGEKQGMFGTLLDVTVPAATLVDAAITYTKNDWRVALNASNLFNKSYVASCTYGCFFGEPLKVSLTVSKRW